MMLGGFRLGQKYENALLSNENLCLTLDISKTEDVKREMGKGD
jgi:hypothetical protein